jgi:uncharacterized protein YejL (UPF0352 family)
VTDEKVDLDVSETLTDEEHAKVIGYEAEMAALELVLCEHSKAAENKIVESYLNEWLHRGNKHRPDKPLELAITGSFATALILGNALRTMSVVLRRVSPIHLDELLGVFADVPKKEQDAVHRIWRELIEREHLSRVPKTLS